MSLHFYAVMKEAIQDDTGLANTLLHLHGGLLILILSRMATRKPLGTFIPFLVVLVLECLNEAIDRVNHGSWRTPDTISDLVNTLFWPFVLSLGVRLRPMAKPADAAVAGNPTDNLTYSINH